MRASTFLSTAVIGNMFCMAAYAAPVADTKHVGEKRHSSATGKSVKPSPSRPEVIRVSAESVAGGRMAPQNGTKSRSEITQAYIAKQAPTPNVFKLLGNLPGANVASADPFGMVSGNMTIRGMNSDQIGFTVEGAPLNDIGSYMAFPTEWVDSENLREVTMQQGSANLDSPVIGASGGIVSMNLLDPSHKMGATIAGSFGSYNTHREYVRLQSGDIGNTGMRAFVAW